MALVARDVSLTVSGTPLVSGVSLEVCPGTVTAVLGPNGAGKTSLVRALVGEVPPSSGTVELDGRPLSGWPGEVLARSLAVLPQHSMLSFPFTAQEVVMLGRTPHATGLARDAQIVREALEWVDGAYLAKRLYTQLSGGEKQRVHLARVLTQIWEAGETASRYLVLDEPTSSFDLAHQRLTLDVVQGLAASGVGVLMVLHDLNLAASCADQMVLMQCGSVAYAGSPEEVLDAATISAVFSIDASIGVHPVTGKPLVIP